MSNGLTLHVAKDSAGRPMLSQLLRQPNGRLVSNSDGTLTATETFICLYSMAAQLLPCPHRTSHPIHPSLVCDTAEVVEEMENGWCTIVATYVGIRTGVGSNTIELPEPEDETICEVADAPFETHPRFNEIATEENGAELENGKWKGWKAESPYLGLDSWVAPQRILRREFALPFRPTDAEVDAKLGKIDANGYLMTKFNIKHKGGIYSISQEWYAPGPKIKQYPVPIYDRAR